MKCDVCSSPIPSGSTWYFLTTKEVLLSREDWKRFFQRLLQHTTLSNIRDQFMWTLGHRAGSNTADTAWAVCEACAPMYQFDRDAASKKALNLASQPATGYALCRMAQKGNDVLIENIDDDAMMAVMKVAQRALEEVETEYCEKKK